jgi:pimeloyl-ACP methyl ester carboxylesterase
MNRRTIEFTTPDGVLLTGVEQGAGPAVMFIHGYSDSWLTWTHVLDRLPGRIRAVAPTLRGHGDSAKPASGYAIGDFAADVVATMDQLGVGDAVVVGHSMGSIIAERIAVDHPRRVRGLVLVGAFAGRCDPALVDAMWNEGIGTLTDPVDPDFVRGFQQSCVAGPVPDDFLDAIVANSRKMPAHAWQLALQGFVDTGVGGRLGTIDVPTLLQWGDRDAYALRADQDALVAAIAGARLSRFEGVGHCPNWEAPARVAAEIVALVDDAFAPVAA